MQLIGDDDMNLYWGLQALYSDFYPNSVKYTIANILMAAIAEILGL